MKTTTRKKEQKTSVKEQPHEKCGKGGICFPQVYWKNISPMGFGEKGPTIYEGRNKGGKDWPATGKEKITERRSQKKRKTKRGTNPNRGEVPGAQYHSDHWLKKGEAVIRDTPKAKRFGRRKIAWGEKGRGGPAAKNCKKEKKGGNLLRKKKGTHQYTRY